jgi:hypothetical protein
MGDQSPNPARKIRMIISAKQPQANRQNAQHSTGPKTPEGKDAVRFNAVTWGLRARNLLIGTDDPTDYRQLWTRSMPSGSRRLTANGIIWTRWPAPNGSSPARPATKAGYRIYDANLQLEKRLALLDRVSVQRVRLERSFIAAMRELKQLQKERQARSHPQPAQPTKAAPPVPHPDYVMSECAEAHPVFCSPVAPDSR